jgi:serpin B
MKKKLVSLLLLGTMTCGVLAGCGAETKPAPTQTPSSATEASTKEVPAEASTEESTDAPDAASTEDSVPEQSFEEEVTVTRESGTTWDYNSKEFEFEFMNAMIENDADGNAVCSPYGAREVLSMVYAGSDGDTNKELSDVLGYDEATYADFVSKNSEVKNYEALQSLNSLWYDEDTLTGFDKGDYAATFKQNFDGSLYGKDLQGSGIVNDVNDYVAKNTHDMIPGIIQYPFDDGIRMMLMNVLYMKETFSLEFDPELTEKETFHATDGDVETDMMHSYEEYYNYCSVGNLESVSLDYLEDRDKGLKLNIIKTMDDSDVVESFKALSPEDRYKIATTNGENKLINLTMPKFEANTSSGLDNIFHSFGLDSMYTAGDMEKMFPDAHVDESLQVARIITDENGTEAAAVTVMMMTDSMAIAEETPQPYIFTVDYPFLFTITDDSGNVYFAGLIRDPSVTE